MARITVEDCLDKENNRFELVITATERARQLAYGAQPALPLENDKPTVMALREIAAGLVNEEGQLKTAAPMDAAVQTDTDATLDSDTMQPIE